MHEWMGGAESALVRICSSFLRNSHISSFQLLPYPVEPGSVMLKLDAVYSSEVSEQTCATWFETPQNNHHLKHRHVKFVFLRNCCHVCECHNSESKFLLVQAMKAYVGVSEWLHSFLTLALDGDEWSVSWIVMGKHPW